MLHDNAMEGLDRRRLCWVLASVVGVKLALLAIDPHLRFFFGDSASYLHAATHGFGLPDRSSTYPFLLWLFVLPTGSLWSLVLWQTLVGVFVASGTYLLLVRTLGVGAVVSWVAAVAVAAEPMQLFYERSVMAETVGTGCLLAMLGALAWHLRWRSLAALPCAAVLGLAAVSFRLSLLPVVLVLTTLAPGLWLFASRAERPGVRSLALMFMLLAGTTALSHMAYRAAYGHAAGIAPAYTVMEPHFRLGWLAPLVERSHFQDAGIDAHWWDSLELDPAEPRHREWQIWSPQGMVHQLQGEAGDDAREVAGRVAARVLGERPLDVLALGWGTLLDHFDVQYAQRRMQNDLGENPPPGDFVERWHQAIGYDASNWRHSDGWVARMFESSRMALTVGIFASFPLSLFGLGVAWRRQSPVLALFAVALLGLAMAYVLFGHILVFRYLHPFVPLWAIIVAALVSSPPRQHRERRGGARDLLASE